jgi:hypothetical protein
MRISRLRACAVLCVLALALVGGLPVLAATQIPKFPKPILVTCTGQTPGSLTLSTLLDKLGIKATHDPMILPSKMGGYKTLVMVMGASLKGLGAAGIDQDEEMERDEIVLAKAKSSGMKVVLAHIEGTARRNAIADKFITPFLPKADLLLVLDESNQDGLFTKAAQKNKIPMVTFKDFSELPYILKQMFP